MGWNALAIGQRWTSSTPAIYLSFYYDLYRSGATQYYKFYTSVSPVHGSSSFGYDINQNIYVDGSHVSSYQLKPVVLRRGLRRANIRLIGLLLAERHPAQQPYRLRFILRVAKNEIKHIAIRCLSVLPAVLLERYLHLTLKTRLRFLLRNMMTASSTR